MMPNKPTVRSTKVTLRRTPDGVGTMTIHFYSDEELDGVLERNRRVPIQRQHALFGTRPRMCQPARELQLDRRKALRKQVRSPLEDRNRPRLPHHCSG